MDQYQAYFQLGELGSSTGLVMMLYPVGNMIGAFCQGPFNDMFGRRIAMGAGSLLIAAGAIILTAAKDESYLLGGRFLLGMGVGTGTSSAPIYAAEIAPPSIRGRVVGFYNTCTSSSLPLTYSSHTPTACLTADPWPSLLHWLDPVDGSGVRSGKAYR